MQGDEVTGRILEFDVIHTGTGDLLHASVDGLVNAVNCEGVMGKGIALQFKQTWPAMYAAYRTEARAGRIRPGEIHVWPTSSASGPRYILNFPTKRSWRSQSLLEDIDAGLVDLVARIRALDLRSVAMPALGAGNGGLDWTVVRPRIIAALEALPDVDVHLWEPGPR